jgi:hypothetical protein
MAHFIAQRDGSGDGLFIAPPYRSAAGDKWFTAASRRLSNADGSFAGIVTAPLDQVYFTQLYRSINLGSSGSVLCCIAMASFLHANRHWRARLANRSLVVRC